MPSLRKARFVVLVLCACQLAAARWCTWISVLHGLAPGAGALGR